MKLYLATNEGFAVAAETETEWQIGQRGLDGQQVTSIIAREGAILAGTTNGIFASEDGGASWQECSDGLTHRHVRWLAFHPDVPDFELAGTEPAGLFVSKNGGGVWHGRSQVEALRDQFGWWLPYSPEAGCVRGFAVHGQRLYAAVEVGGLLRSDDAGETWGLVAGSNGRPQFGRPPAKQLHPDVHSVVVHPASPDLVLAPTGGGFYVSTDGGDTWECRYANCYVRAVWVDPEDANHMILGPSAGPDGRNGRIERSTDGGQTGTRLTDPQPHNMVERFYQAENYLFAVMSAGQLWASDLTDRNWQSILPAAPHINAVTHPVP